MMKLGKQPFGWVVYYSGLTWGMIYPLSTKSVGRSVGRSASLPGRRENYWRVKMMVV